MPTATAIPGQQSATLERRPAGRNGDQRGQDSEGEQPGEPTDGGGIGPAGTDDKTTR
jgi:hypothetical protein